MTLETPSEGLLGVGPTFHGEFTSSMLEIRIFFNVWRCLMFTPVSSWNQVRLQTTKRTRHQKTLTMKYHVSSWKRKHQPLQPRPLQQSPPPLERQPPGPAKSDRGWIVIPLGSLWSTKNIKLLCFGWSPPWHSIHPIWHSVWQIFWHSIWHSVWDSIWHSIWHSFRHSIWHIFWHSIWHIYLAFHLAYLLAFYLAYLLTFYLAYLLTFYLAYLSGTSIWYSIWQIFWHSIWHSLWHSIWLCFWRLGSG